MQITKDGEAVVFHDFTLDRLTQATGRVDALTLAELGQVAFRKTGDRIVTLAAYLAAIDGRVPLVCEIKSRFDDDFRLTDRAARLVAASKRPVALKSFDPAIIAHLQRHRDALGLAAVPLGMIAEANYVDKAWDGLTVAQKNAMANFLHYDETRPDFLSYQVNDLAGGVPFLLRRAAGLPVMTWTVRTPEQRQHAGIWADQMVFEGFVP